MAELEEKVQEQQINGNEGGENVKDHSVNAAEREERVEALNDHNLDESVTDGNQEEMDGNVIDDRHVRRQENGAKRIKEECICPPMGKLMECLLQKTCM